MNINELKKRVDPFKNTLIIDVGSFKICKIIDIIEDDGDYYWVIDTEDEIVHSSCVIDWIPLKNNLEDKDYKRLVNLWNLNNVEPAD